MVSVPQGRKIILRDETHGADHRHLDAYLDIDGALHIDGQDIGPGTAIVSGDGEYEWFQKIAAEHMPRLVALLGGMAGGDIMQLLADQYTDAGSYELERLLRDSGIPVERFVYGG